MTMDFLMWPVDDRLQEEVAANGFELAVTVTEETMVAGRSRY